MDHREIEVRFLEVDKDALIQKLCELGAKDEGEVMFEERIIYDKELTWRDGAEKILRLRTQGGVTKLAYKHRTQQTADGVEEIEFEVGDAELAEILLDRLGYGAYRHQQKLRHTFKLEEVTVDIDTWPRIPTYVEFEGPSVEALQSISGKLGFKWEDVELRSPRTVIEEVYRIPVGQMSWFTFGRFE